MKIKFISAAITAALLVMTITPVMADSFDHTRETELVTTLGIMNGYPDGSFGLDSFVSRAEFTNIAIAASSYRNSVAANLAVSPFHDVKYTHWAAPYIKLASSNKLINGYSDSTFRPDNTVTYEEAVTILLKLLGYTDEDFGSAWPYGQVGIAQKLELTKNLDAGIGTELTRGNVVTLIFNMLNTKSKGGGSYYIEALDYKIIEDAVLIATSVEDSSVGAGKILTSEGSFKIGDSFNYGDVGSKGDLVIKDSESLIMFVPTEQTKKSYTIYQSLDDSLIAYEDGSMRSVDIDKSVTVYNKSAKTTLSALMGSIATGDILTLYHNAAGVLDYATIKTENLAGPITVKSSDWYLTEGISPENAVVMRDGVKISLSEIQLNDIAYYSKELNTIWTYSRKVTGIYESAAPNKDSLTSVVVSGTTYEIESAAAFNALSSSGKYNYGDTVTLLIGRNGKVADVLSQTSADGDTFYGYLTATGTKEFKNANGDVYTSFYVDVVLPDGNTYEYASKRVYTSTVNSVVRIRLSDGIATVSSYSASGNQLSGTVDAASGSIGSYKLASDVKILDVNSTAYDDPTAYCSVFLQRLDGVKLSGGSIAYAGKNSSGEYNEIILKNVTGDIYEYGVVIKAENTTSGTIRGSYTYDIGGSQSSFSTNGSAYTGIYSGQPARFLLSGGKPESMTALSAVKSSIDTVTASAVQTSGGVSYKLSDSVVVYRKNSEYKYTVMPLSSIIGSSEYKLTAYYDKSEAGGGRIRVIIASDKA